DRVRKLCVAAVLFDDEQRSRLLAAPVAACCLGRVEAVQQALGQRARRGLERLGDRVDSRRRDEDVALRGVATTCSAARPLEALGAGEARAAALAVDDAELSLVPSLVCSRQQLDDLLGGEPLAQEA